MKQNITGQENSDFLKDWNKKKGERREWERNTDAERCVLCVIGYENVFNKIRRKNLFDLSGKYVRII